MPGKSREAKAREAAAGRLGRASDSLAAAAQLLGESKGQAPEAGLLAEEVADVLTRVKGQRDALQPAAR